MACSVVRRQVILAFGLCIGSQVFVAAQEAVEEMEGVVVSARYPDATLPESAFSQFNLEREELTSAPQGFLDEALKTKVPGFSLFRRASSEVANPTSQGPTLRNIGPNGAGRTLVLLDGIPMNDPFGGWVNWQRFPAAMLGDASIIQGGGAGLFGNNALGGTIHLTRHRPQHFSASIMGGSRELWDGTLLLRQDFGPAEVDALLHGQTSGGYPTVRSDQRGPVDIDADSSSCLFEGGVRTQLAPDLEAVVRASWFEEERSNGTPYTGNSTEALDLSFGLTGHAGEVRWETLLFYQDRRYESTFSSVNGTRTAETPALDQYNVPAQSLGFSFTTTLPGGLVWWDRGSGDDSRLITGIDARWTEGETQERFRYVDGRFLNDRKAGGQQLLLGAFAEQLWDVSEDLSVTLGGRLDYWNLNDGSRVEKVIDSGELLLNNRFDDRDGLTANGRLGAAWAVAEQITLRGAAYTGFRVPTLNELYRPFRVGNDITAANDALEPETLVGLDAGVNWRPVETVSLNAGVFWNRLNDAVTNVTLLEGYAVAPDGTVVPEGGVYRQRQNVEAAITTGVELGAEWDVVEQLRVSTSYCFTHTEINDSNGDLEGKALAQAPDHVLTGGLTWKPHALWEARVQARYGSEQFEDDLNTLTLADYVVWDASITYHIREGVSLSFVAANVFDTEVETGKTASGIVTVGAPRWLGLRLKWEL